MRDIAISLLVFGLLTTVFKHPVMGAYVWAWLSMMSPHKLAFGFAFDMPFAAITAVVTLLAFLLTRKRFEIPMNGIVVAHVLLMIWMTVTCIFAVAPLESVFARWVFVAKIQLMLYVTLMLLGNRKQLDILIWVVTFSVAFYGIKGGIWTVLTGGGGRVWGPPGGLIQGNNELAVALVMLMPMLAYLHHTTINRWLRYGLVACMASVAFSILGSQSRGALLALVAMLVFLGIKGKNPIRTSLLLLVFAAMAISFMPDTWTSRMDTLGDYQQETSALSRIWTWKTMWAAALDNPLVGVGFSGSNAEVFARYAPVAAEYDVFRGRVFVAHSIYFQVLGEHGFVGFGLYLLFGVITWRTAGRLAQKVAGDPEFGSWMPYLLRMTQVSLIGFAVGGAFLSLAYFDFPYYAVGYVIVCDAMVRRRAAAHAAPAPSAQLAPRAQPAALTTNHRLTP